MVTVWVSVKVVFSPAVLQKKKRRGGGEIIKRLVIIFLFTPFGWLEESGGFLNAPDPFGQMGGGRQPSLTAEQTFAALRAPSGQMQQACTYSSGSSGREGRLVLSRRWAAPLRCPSRLKRDGGGNTRRRESWAAGLRLGWV